LSNILSSHKRSNALWNSFVRNNQSGIIGEIRMPIKQRTKIQRRIVATGGEAVNKISALKFGRGKTDGVPQFTTLPVLSFEDSAGNEPRGAGAVTEAPTTGSRFECRWSSMHVSFSTHAST
jgi:hypothetical protein